MGDEYVRVRRIDGWKDGVCTGCKCISGPIYELEIGTQQTLTIRLCEHCAVEAIDGLRHAGLTVA